MATLHNTEPSFNGLSIKLSVTISEKWLQTATQFALRGMKISLHIVTMAVFLFQG